MFTHAAASLSRNDVTFDRPCNIYTATMATGADETFEGDVLDCPLYRVVEPYRYEPMAKCTKKVHVESEETGSDEESDSEPPQPTLTADTEGAW